MRVTNKAVDGAARERRAAVSAGSQVLRQLGTGMCARCWVSA